MDENVAAAKQTIEKFSELLRYQLYDQQQLVPIQQELQHLQNFIHVQKARASDQLQLTLKIDSALNNEKLYPLLLLPLVENAFKYVGGDYQLSIEARKEGAWLWFAVQNSVPAQSPQKSSGIGLENLKRRLQLLYPGKHRLITAKEHDHYFAELKLQYA